MLAESDPFNVGGFELINSFEMSYNWQGHHILNEISKGHKTANYLKENIQRNLDIYEDNHILLNFTSNHDENTWAGTVFDRMGESYLTMSVLTYVMPGIPLLYNGQEYSLNKRLEFFEKDFIPKENKKLVEFYTSLGQIKRNNKALHFSKDTRFNLKDTNDNDVLIIERSLENQTILFISNLSDESKEISHNINGDYRNLISGEITNLNSIEKLNFESWDYLLLEKL